LSALYLKRTKYHKTTSLKKDYIIVIYMQNNFKLIYLHCCFGQNLIEV